MRRTEQAQILRLERRIVERDKTTSPAPRGRARRRPSARRSRSLRRRSSPTCPRGVDIRKTLGRTASATPSFSGRRFDSENQLDHHVREAVVSWGGPPRSAAKACSNAAGVAPMVGAYPQALSEADHDGSYSFS